LILERDWKQGLLRYQFRAILKETYAKVPFQEFRHSGGMTESSPAIHRRVCQRERMRPGGTLDQSCMNKFQPSLRDFNLLLEHIKEPRRKQRGIGNSLPARFARPDNEVVRATRNCTAAGPAAATFNPFGVT
jgi:hypothetical protein